MRTFTRVANMSPGLRDTGDEIDAAHINELQQAAEDLQTGDLPIALAGIEGALGAYTGPWRGPHDCREWGIDADGNDHASDFATMATELASETNRAVQFVPGVINVGATVPIGFYGFRCIGADGVIAAKGGTQINFSGTGALFEIGEDSEDSGDVNVYDGWEGQLFENLCLLTATRDTSLVNGYGEYLDGSVAVRDWRGGHIRLRNCDLRGWQYGFWGTQSDINRFDDCRFAGNKVAMHLGPRCDQFLGMHLYTFSNDTAMEFDRVWGARIVGLQSVFDGSVSTPPIKIGSQWTLGCEGIVFDAPWFEHTGGEVEDIDAYVEIGVGDSTPSQNIVFRNPFLMGPSPGVDHHVKHFLRVENGDLISVENMSGFAASLDALIRFTGTTSPSVRVIGSTGGSQELAMVNDGSGDPLIVRERWGDGVAWSHGLGATPEDFSIDRYAFGVPRLGVRTASPTSTLHINGSMALPYKSVSADTEVSSIDHTFLVDASSAARTITLQPAAEMVGRIYTIKKMDSSGNAVIVDGDDAETIDGAETVSLTTQYQFVTVQSTGTAWVVIGSG